jgi:hypothetical protein
MSLLTTSAASIHQLSAAAALAGPPKAPITQSNSLTEDGARTVKSFWSVYDAAANMLLSAGWFIEQRTLRKRNLDRSTNTQVAIKDICVMGAMLSNIGNIVAEQMFKREFPDGIPVTSSGEPAPDASARAAAYCKYFKTAKLVNRLCVAGAIGFTPLVNFNVLKSYRPGTLYRLFT